MGIIKNPTFGHIFINNIFWDKNNKILQCCIDCLNLRYFPNTRLIFCFKIPIFLDFTTVLVQLAHVGWGYLYPTRPHSKDAFKCPTAPKG
jgi:hypothetical protein